MHLKCLLFAGFVALVTGKEIDEPADVAKCMAWVMETLRADAGSYHEEKIGESEQKGSITPVGPIAPGWCACDWQIAQLEEKIQELQDTVKLLWSASNAPVDSCLSGMEDGSIPDAAITASSFFDHKDCYIEHARLDGQNGSWCAVKNTVGQWIQVDLGKASVVTGIVTQGRSNWGQWVTEYQVSYGDDELMPIMDGNDEKVFLANTDNKRKVYNRFPHSVKARFIRIYPVAWHGHISMRFDLTYC